MLTREKYHEELTALNAALYPAMMEMQGRGITSPKPEVPVFPSILELCEYDGWRLNDVRDIALGKYDQDYIEMDASTGKARRVVMKFGQVTIQHAESSDGMRPAGYYEKQDWYVDGTIDVTEKYLPELKKWQEIWRDDQKRHAGEVAFQAEISAVIEWLRGKKDVCMEKYHADVEAWETESVQNFMVSREIDLDLEPGHILVRDNPYDEYPSRAGLELLEYILKTFV